VYSKNFTFVVLKIEIDSDKLLFESAIVLVLWGFWRQLCIIVVLEN